jgi:hypothetical protein
MILRIFELYAGNLLNHSAQGPHLRSVPRDIICARKPEPIPTGVGGYPGPILRTADTELQCDCSRPSHCIRHVTRTGRRYSPGSFGNHVGLRAYGKTRLHGTRRECKSSHSRTTVFWRCHMEPAKMTKDDPDRPRRILDSRRWLRAGGRPYPHHISTAKAVPPREQSAPKSLTGKPWALWGWLSRTMLAAGTNADKKLGKLVAISRPGSRNRSDSRKCKRSFALARSNRRCALPRTNGAPL